MFPRNIIRRLSTNAVTASTEKGGFHRMRKVRAHRPIIQEQRARNQSLETEADAAKLDWRIMCATILHRYPEITPDPKPWEAEFRNVQAKISSAHREMLVKELENTPDAMLVDDVSMTSEEIIETMPFKPASRVTEADKTNDRRSLERRLQDSLFLIVRRNRNDFAWQFPQGKVLESETLRGAADRVLQRTGQVDTAVSPAVSSIALLPDNAWMVSNSPVGHYQYAYSGPVKEKRQQFGAKVFFTRAQYTGGCLQPIKVSKKLYKDFAWIARDEVFEYFDAETAKYLHALLPH
jgi:large subunit ribosomal protein L46